MTLLFFFFQAEDGIRDYKVTGVQTCALPISRQRRRLHAVPVPLAARRAGGSGGGTGGARRGARAARRLRGSGRSVGVGRAAGAARGVRSAVARRAVSLRRDRLGQAVAGRSLERPQVRTDSNDSGRPVQKGEGRGLEGPNGPA